MICHLAIFSHFRIQDYFSAVVVYPLNAPTSDLCFPEIDANLTFVDVLSPISFMFRDYNLCISLQFFKLVVRREKTNEALSLSS